VIVADQLISKDCMGGGGWGGGGNSASLWLGL
jgi:hypothetical protein